jgi:GMP synthase PP-ATPase subunit
MNIEIEGRQVDIYWSKMFHGYGHYKVTCDINAGGERFTCNTISTDTQFIDNLSDIEYYDEKQQMLHDKFYNEMEERIKEFLNK